MVAQGSIGVDAVRAGVERGCDLLGEAFENLRTTNRLAIEPGQRCVGVRVVEEVEVPTIGGDRYDPIARALRLFQVTYGLAVTGELDPATVAALQETYGC